MAANLGQRATVIWLVDTCVAESARGRGLAGILMDQRLRAGVECGCCMAIGACSVANTPMQRLLASRGFNCVELQPNAFPDGSSAEVYTKYLGA